MMELVAFDLETTGLSPRSDRVIEVGAVRFDLAQGERGRLQLLVDPGMPIPLPVQRLTGIGDADVAGQTSAVEAMAQLAEFCADAELVGHGTAFDLAFCSQLLPRAFARRSALDTLELARILLPTAPSHGLGSLCQQLGLRHDRPHRALSDAEATAALLRTLVEMAARMRPGTVAQMRRVAGQTEGPLSRFFDLVGGPGSAPERTSGEPGGRSQPAAPAAPPGGAGPGRPQHAPDEEAVSPRRPSQEALPAGLADAADWVLGPRGGLGERPGYEYREAQQQMARAVAQVLERGGRLLVEAGTGVGKSLGYLTPLSLWLEREGGRAVVATHTLTLQEQLAHHDLPALQPLLPRPLRWAVLKGRNHYVSLRRLHRYLRRGDAGPHGADLDAIRFKLKLLRWLEVTATGDRAELHLGASERELWRHVESSAADCLGGACANWRSGTCPMVAARSAARDAELVVTNHALLLGDDGAEGAILGDHDALVVDEAHHLEEAATRAGGHRLRWADVSLVLERLPGISDPRLAARLEACRDAGQRLFGETKGLLAERLGGGEGARSGTLSLPADAAGEPWMQPLRRRALQAITALRAAEGGLRAARPETAVEAELLPQPQSAADELELAAAALEDCARAVEDVLLTPRPGHIAWLELRAEQAELRDAPTAAGESLGAGLLDRSRSTVLTSATLAVAGDFGFVRERLGLRSRVDELAVGSPFDFLAQALCVLVTDVPPYDASGYEPALAGITEQVARRLGGRTLGLFTGYSALRRIRDLLARSLAPDQIAVVAQGVDGTRRQLLASFQQSPRTVLLGTSSFWEGIDVPGDALQCVVIAKLPFAVPTDPLVRARTEGMTDPFGGYVLPDAVIRLRQGFGRLIRSTADRGVVVIADSRLTSRDYAQRFLDALPPAAVVRTPARDVAARVAEFIRAAPPP